jgi:alpha-D-xyloside xylohydrolase
MILTHPRAGQVDNGPHYELNTRSGHVSITMEKETNKLTYTSGPLNLAIHTDPNELGFAFEAQSKRITGHSWRSIGYVADQRSTQYNHNDGIYASSQGYMLTELDLGVNEKIYGLGERFGPFVKNGQTIDIWNEDGGTSSELAYKNIPFYMSSKGYGVFVNHPGKVSLEVQSERTTRVNISVPGEEIEYFVIYGPTPKDVLRRYTALTGRPGLVPAWSYNLWLTTSFTTDYDEGTVSRFLDGFEERSIPLGVFHFDCFWMKSYQWCDFEFDRDMFPDAAGYLARLKERGLRISVWINPYVGQASPLFEEGRAKGFFIEVCLSFVG